MITRGYDETGCCDAGDSPDGITYDFRGSELKSPTVSDSFTLFMLKLKTFTGGIAETNGYLLQIGDRFLAVDAPEGMADWLARQNVTPEALLLTHQHFDHVLDAGKIQSQFKSPLFAFSALSRELTLEKQFGVGPGSPYSVPEFRVDTVLEGTKSIEVGGFIWNLLHIPGHSPDSICFHQPELGIVFGGDVLFLDGIGRSDFPGGSGSLLISGIKEKLFELPDETKVFPGHGPATSVGRERQENPFLA